MDLPDNWADDALAVYLAFRSADGTRVTNSICLKNDAYEGGGSEGVAAVRVVTVVLRMIRWDRV